MSTKIYITPPGETTQELTIYDECTVSMSVTDKAGSITITSANLDDGYFDLFTVGSDIKIVQDDNVSRGWILNPPRRIDGNISIISIQGLSYTARTQKILVNELYASQKISDIAIDLFQTYAPDYNLESVVACDKIISIKFSDVFLFDAMEQLAALAGYEWFIDEPVPELVDVLPQPQGWQELVETVIHTCAIPSETIYPSELLYPC